MKKISVLILSLVSLLPVSAISADDLLENFKRSLFVPSLQGEFHITLISKSGDTREIVATIYQQEDVEENQNMRLFLFNSPPGVKGTGILVHSYYDDRDNNMWMYLPTVGRIKRISLESSGGGNMMGSDFTYRDLISIDVNDLKFEMLDDAVLDDVDCYVMKSMGASADIRNDMGYDHMISYHRKDNFMLYKREFFDVNGDLLKIYQAEGFLDLSPAIYPTLITMTNVQTGHKSIIEVLDVKTDVIEDDIFTPRYLESSGSGRRR
jgi:hypothetical protein